MIIQLAVRKLALGKSLRASIRAGLAQQLRRFAPAIRAVTVQIMDRNGRRGGADKRCRIRVELMDGPRLVETEIRADPRMAFAKALDRLAHVLHRHLRRPAKRLGGGHA